MEQSKACWPSEMTGMSLPLNVSTVGCDFEQLTLRFETLLNCL